jgi:diguanylate cyclase (GGDEF)-like protein
MSWPNSTGHKSDAWFGLFRLCHRVPKETRVRMRGRRLWSVDAGWPEVGGEVGDTRWSFEVLDFLPEPAFVVAVEQRGARARFRWSFGNRAWRRTLGLSAGETLHGDAADHLPPDCAARHLAHYAAALRTGAPVRFEERTAASQRLVSFQVAPVHGDEGICTHLIVTGRDETEQRATEEQLFYQSRHDTLTGLANRSLLAERLRDALTHAARANSATAVLLLDIDNFKVVNDSLGHDAGDRLFVAVARRVERVLRFGDTLARFGGDELAIVCSDIATLDEARALADRVAKVFLEPYTLQGSEVFISASIGIAISEGRDDTPERLLRDADAALFTAKALGRNRVETFDETMRARAVERLETERALRHALMRGELRVHYQPLVRFDYSEVMGFEALLRWEHPERGMLLPADFLPIAEETGLIVPIGAWVLHEVCRQASRWAADAPPDSMPLGVSVNLSARQLAHPDLVGTVAEAIATSGLPPELLVLEITESVLMTDRDLAVTILHALRSLGVRLSVDDFGTGHSSLGYLKTLPVDSLKIDRSFIDGLGDNPDDSAIVAAVVRLGHALGLTVTAEGIETPLQLAELRSLGCDLGQGFYFARPQPGEIAAALVHHRLRWRSDDVDQVA